MKIPTSNMSSERLLFLGDYHLAAVTHTAATMDLAAAMTPIVAGLRADWTARVAAEHLLLPIRVALRFHERDVERHLRVLSASAYALDGKRGGAVHTALFPDGVEAETRPKAQGQVDAAQRVLNRLNTSSLAEGLRAAHAGPIAESTAVLETTLASRKTAASALGMAMAAEFSSREDLVRTYDSNAGAIRQRFPKDRETQDLYFDTFSVRRSTSDDEADVGEEELGAG
jgi:hypothetical protein